MPLGVSRPAMTGRGPRARPPPARNGSSHSSGGGSPSAAPRAAGRGPARRRSKRSTRASIRAMARQPRASTPSSAASPISSRHRGSESRRSTPETTDTAPAPSRIDPATASARGTRAAPDMPRPNSRAQRWHVPQPVATSPESASLRRFRNRSGLPGGHRPAGGRAQRWPATRQPAQRVPYRCSRASWSSCSKAIPRAPMASAAAGSSAAPRRPASDSPGPRVGSAELIDPRRRQGRP